MSSCSVHKVTVLDTLTIQILDLDGIGDPEILT